MNVARNERANLSLSLIFGFDASVAQLSQLVGSTAYK
jgi:hypothetical protein